MIQLTQILFNFAVHTSKRLMMVNVFLTPNLTIVICSNELTGDKINLGNWCDPQVSDFFGGEPLFLRSRYENTTPNHVVLGGFFALSSSTHIFLALRRLLTFCLTLTN